MTNVRIGFPQQIGPLEVWPVNWGGAVSKTPFEVYPFGGQVAFAELPNPEVGTLQISNIGDGNVFIPSGWIIGAELLQVRTLNDGVYIPAGQELDVAVSCVEQGRWSEGSNPIDGGRAPLSVIAAGRAFDDTTRRWRVDPRSRQQRVWQQVHRQETRTGARPTSSLMQVIDEDSRHDRRIARLQHEFLSNLRFEAGNNGYLLCLKGEPLLMEVFAQERVVKQVLKSTLRTLSFDVEDTAPSRPTERAVVESFIASLALDDLALQRTGERTFKASRGSEQVAFDLFYDEQFHLQHLSATNHAHRMLIGV